MNLLEELKKAMQNVDDVVGSFGTDSEDTIDTAISKLMEVKELLSIMNEEVELLESDVERLNTRNRELRTANNNLSRLVYSKDEALEKQKQELEEIQKLSDIF